MLLLHRAAFRCFSFFRLQGCCSDTTRRLSAYHTAPKVPQSSSSKVRLLLDLPSPMTPLAPDSSAPAGAVQRVRVPQSSSRVRRLLVDLLQRELPRSPPLRWCASDVQEYQRSFLRPVTAQLSSRSSAVASVLEQHSAELSAAQQWESEWNSQGLLSRLTPQVGPQLQAGDQKSPPGRWRASPVSMATLAPRVRWLCVVEQEYRSRKQTRLHKRIEEQLRSAVLPPSESASTSDLSEVLQSLRGSAPSDSLLLKGTHFTHTQKFSFTRVSSSSRSSGVNAAALLTFRLLF